jgi:chemotaxis signal transduction protein
MSLEPIGSTATTLRRAFDRSFAEARGEEAEALQNLLAIRIGGDPYAVRLSEIASLHADRKVVSVPTRTPDLVGLVGLRGLMAPVYDLRTLLGYAGGAAPRWLLFVRTPDLVGFAFDLFEAHLRAGAQEMSSTNDGDAASPYVRGVIRTADGIRSLIHIASLKEAITRRADSDRPPKER